MRFQLTRQLSPSQISRGTRVLFALLVMVMLLPAGTSSVFAQKKGSPDEATNSSKKFGHKQNHLARETSPYLRMHADNPVDWYPWGPEALQKATTENKPIFLSIGYSSCFWCHVMERQVFENEEIAAYMNEHFVNIKVDREERPDIDDVYMTALQIYFQLAGSTQGGGWPLSIFLTPEGKPIAGGTYFPPKETPGHTSFPTVLRQIQKAWQTREKDVRATSDLITQETARLTRPPTKSSPVELNAKLVNAAVTAVVDSYDPEFGGFDFNPKAPEGPKFPVPSRLKLLQAQIGRTDSHTLPDAAAMLDLTLTRMASGGLWDHLGGGFHRYSTDRRWQVPHFEKMLYDNAQLAEIYVDAYRRTGRDSFRQVAAGIFSFIKAELTGPRGEFYSALDAETDGIEGQYYVWSKAELAKVLSASDLRVFAMTYGMNQPSPFEHGYVLQLRQPLEKVAVELGMPLRELQLRLKEMHSTLLAIRRQRAPLFRDDKVIAAWNGLMIRAYARAGQVLKRRDYIESAEKAALNLLMTHRNSSGELLRIGSGSNTEHPAFLDDYAFLTSGLLALYEATGEEKWLNASRRLMDEQLSRFWDPDHGGFFYTANDQEVVLVRLKNAADQVLPSGNSVSAENLVKLSRLRSDEAYRVYAQKLFKTFGSQFQSSPGRFPYLALSLQGYLHWYGTPESKAAGGQLFSGGLSTPLPASSRPTPKMKSVPEDSKKLKFAPVPNVDFTLFANPDDASRHPHIRARGAVSADELPRGGECDVAVEVLIEEGWHLNSNPPKPDFVIPVSVSVAGPPGVEIKEIRYPPGEEFRVEGIEEPLSVYSDRIVLRGVLAIPELSGDVVELQVNLQYQACNEESCQTRQVLKLTGKIPLTKRNQEKPKAKDDTSTSPAAPK